MKRIIVNKILSWGLIMMCLGFLIGCGTDEYKQIDFGGTFANSTNIEPLLITEHGELVSVFSEYDIEWENELTIWDRYDDSFFENKALVVYIFDVSGDVDPQITIKAVQNDNGVIKISLIQHGMTAGLMNFQKNIILEVSKDFIGESTTVEVDIEIK